MAPRKPKLHWSLPDNRRYDVGSLPEIGYFEEGPYKIVLHAGNNAFFSILYHTFKNVFGEVSGTVNVYEAETREVINSLFEKQKAYCLKKLAEERAKEQNEDDE